MRLAINIARQARPLLICLALHGCTTIPYEPDQEMPPVTTAEPEQQQTGTLAETPPPDPAPERATEPAPPVAPPIMPPSLTVIVSNDIPAYTGVADEITRLAGEQLNAIYSLRGGTADAAEVMADIEESGSQTLVAIGLLAAEAAREYSDVPVVFCQIFNHAEHELLARGARGVELLPPFSMQLAAWKQLSPELDRVGVITGPGHGEMIARATRSARAAGVELVSRVVDSDKEALYVFKRLVPNIDGFWLLPDNRILSPRVIRELMDYGRKHDKQILAFSPTLLEWGAVMSVTSIDEDVASQVLHLVGAGLPPDMDEPSQLIPLTKMQVEINEALAEKLGLNVPTPRVMARAE
jgi:ABC-type uncharacterized transport system substrate-binding protein